MSDAALELGEFFDYIWQDTEAWAYVPVQHIDRPAEQSFEKNFFKWPRQRRGLVDFILRASAIPTQNVFYSPALFSRTNPRKEGVLGSHVLWLDFDGNAPKTWPTDIAPEPTLIVQSSLETNQHCYWLLDEFMTDIELLEDRNRALAIALNADTSGWDADQILRPPRTINRKRNLPTKIVKWDRE